MNPLCPVSFNLACPHCLHTLCAFFLLYTLSSSFTLRLFLVLAKAASSTAGSGGGPWGRVGTGARRRVSCGPKVGASKLVACGSGGHILGSILTGCRRFVVRLWVSPSSAAFSAFNLKWNKDNFSSNKNRKGNW